MTEAAKHRKERLENLGWGVFVLSAICYIAAGLRAGDPLSIVGALLFLGACFLFLAPAVEARRERKRGAARHPAPSATT